MAKNKVVVKSMNILRLFEQYESLTLNDMVALTESPKTTVMRMVGSLEDMGFLSRREDRRYVLGLPFLHYGQLVADRLDLRRVALPFMIGLRDQMNEAVALIIPDGDQAMYVEKVDTSQMVRVYTKVGRRAPYYAGACPRILLAFMDDNWLSQYLESVNLIQVASGTITDKKMLHDTLHQSRTEGYSISFSELENGAAAIAAPIRNHKQEVVAGLSIMGTDYRFQEHKDQGLITLVIETAKKISECLGAELSSAT